MLDEYQPILDPVYDFRTSCTKDEAVQYILGWLQGPLRFNANPEESELCDFSLDTILTESRESAEIAYSDAKMEEIEHSSIDLKKLQTTNIANKLAELQACDLAIIKAHQYLCYIDYELAKGVDSALKIDPYATENPQSPHILIGSLSKWAHDAFNIDIFKPNESVINFKQQHQELSRTKRDNLQIKFALLVEVYAKTASGLQHGEKPNVKAIAEKLVAQAADNTISVSAAEKAISDAMKVKNSIL